MYLSRALFSYRCDATASPCHEVVHLLSLAEMPSNMARLRAGTFTGTARRSSCRSNALTFVYLPPPAVPVGRRAALRLTDQASVRRRRLETLWAIEGRQVPIVSSKTIIDQP